MGRSSEDFMCKRLGFSCNVWHFRAMAPFSRKAPAGGGKHFASPTPGGSFAMKLLGRETGESIMPALKRLAERRFGVDLFGAGVDGREADFDVLRPVRDQPPAHDIEAALPGLGVVMNDCQRVGRRDVPARREIWR